MSWSVSDIPDQTGKIALVTGANAGMGREVARVLAAKNAEVVLAVRNTSKGTEAAQAIMSEHPGAKLHAMALDLSDLSSVRTFAQRFNEMFDKLDILINNAGFYAADSSDMSRDGFALMMAINHLGHFALTSLLLDKVLATPNARVVTVSSSAYKGGSIDPDTFHTTEAARTKPYQNSKLANMLFMLELQRRFESLDTTALSVAAGPGPTKSDGAKLGIQSISNRALRGLAIGITDLLMNTVAQGALPVLRAATDANANGGDYFTPGGFNAMWGPPVANKPTKSANDPALAKTLWARSTELTGA